MAWWLSSCRTGSRTHITHIHLWRRMDAVPWCQWSNETCPNKTKLTWWSYCWTTRLTFLPKTKWVLVECLCAVSVVLQRMWIKCTTGIWHVSETRVYGLGTSDSVLNFRVGSKNMHGIQIMYSQQISTFRFICLFWNTERPNPLGMCEWRHFEAVQVWRGIWLCYESHVDISHVGADTIGCRIWFIGLLWLHRSKVQGKVRVKQCIRGL